MSSEEKPTPDYTVGTIVLAGAIIDYLARNFLEPRPIAAIVEAIPDATRDSVFRALWTMEKLNWVRQGHAGWELGNRFTLLGEEVRRATIQMLSYHLGGTYGA